MHSEVVNLVAYAVVYTTVTKAGNVFKDQKTVALLKTTDDVAAAAKELIDKMIRPTSSVVRVDSVAMIGHTILDRDMLSAIRHGLI